MKAWNRFAIVCAIVGFTLAMSASSAIADDASDGQSGSQTSPLQGNSMGVMGGIMLSDEYDDPFLLGVDARFTFDVGTRFALSLNPAFTYHIISTGGHGSAHLMQFDINLLGKINLGAPVAPYGGFGVPIVHARASALGFDYSETDVFFNVFVGGLSYEFNDVVGGFTQLRLTRFSAAGFSTLEPALMTGINFDVGGGQSSRERVRGGR